MRTITIPATGPALTTCPVPSTRPAAFAPVWRRRQLENLERNGGRIVAYSVTAGGRGSSL